ncbi:LamG domain-containing protein [Roseivirga sp. BDSF3-8]|uniref:LamG domain-containing protein n=1 Tax=Roseivirga sp. BDSF3-8 TaxID=3241598 RepID=UPI0035321BC1
MKKVLLPFFYTFISLALITACSQSEEIEPGDGNGGGSGNPGSGSGGGSGIIVSNGLVAYFPMDGNASDISGNINNGSVRGQPESVSGLRGQAYRFNSIQEGDNGCGLPGGDYIRLPAMGPIWEDGFTFTGWVQFDGEKRNYERIFDFGNGRGEDGGMLISLSRLDSTNNLALTSWLDEDPIVNRDKGRVIANDAIVKGVPMYVAAVITPEGTMQIWIDGRKVAEKIEGQPVANIARENILLGRSSYCREDPDFKGLMDEVRIYNRALERDEIQELYEDLN